MGQKVNPHGLRVGVIKDWDSRWYAREEKVGDLIVEDYKIRKYLKKTLLESPSTSVSWEDDVFEWESSGWFPPTKPFVVEFAPKELLEEYYAHLRETYERFVG